MTGFRGDRLRRVLIIVQNLPVPFDRRVWSEAKSLTAAGYQVTIICPTGRGYEARHEILDGISIHRHPLPREGASAIGYLLEYSVALLWEFWLAVRVSRREGFDVVHACNPPDLIVLVGGFFKLLSRKRFLFDHHDICPELYQTKFASRGLAWRLLRLFERLTFATADVSIATNESYRRIAVERGRMDPSRVFVVRSGPNLARLKRTCPNPEWRENKTHMVAYVGVIGKQEGIDLLLDAAKRITVDYRRLDVQFVIVGSGPELEEMQHLCTRLELDDCVTFTGRIDDPSLMEILSTADIGVNPDRWSEFNDKSTMNKVMEYMALGLPVVQFETTEGRFSAKEASLYARPNDTGDLAAKILDLIDNPQKRRQMGEFGRQRVLDALAWEHEEPKLLAAYDTLFNLYRKPRSSRSGAP